MKKRLGSILLFLKLTGQFILFGVLISYFALVLNTLSAGRQIFERFTQSFEDVSLGLTEKGEDWLYRSFIENPARGETLVNSLVEMIPEEDRENLSFAIFMKTSPGGDWETVAGKGVLSSASIDVDYNTGETWGQMLEKTLDKGVYHREAFYIGKAKKRMFLLDLTPEESSRSYVLAIEFFQESIGNILLKNREDFWLYTLTIVSLSFILGILFSSPLAHSIRTLTERALQVSRGDEDVSFRNHRLDDLGILSRAMDRMTHNLRHRARTMETMNRIDRAVLSSLSRGELLSRVISYIADQFSDSGLAVLEREGDHFLVLALKGREERAEAALPSGEKLKWPLPSDSPDLSGIDLSSHASFRSLFGEEGMGRHTVAYPLILDEESLGYIVITRDLLDDQDREALRMLADQAGVALKSLNDFRAREKLYEGLLDALSRSVDAKSRWTDGHSRRVTDLSLSLAAKARVGEGDLERIRLAGRLHDLGKLAIPESILDKPGRLDREEYEIIKSHPLRGYEILGEIPGFEEVRKGIRGHHERWDGEGYPDGLAGEGIPLIARIITICDVYDAVTEDRPYRKGFTASDARDFMLSERGKLFDPRLLDMFLEVLDCRNQEGMIRKTR